MSGIAGRFFSFVLSDVVLRALMFAISIVWRVTAKLCDWLGNLYGLLAETRMRLDAASIGEKMRQPSDEEIKRAAEDAVRAIVAMRQGKS